MEAPQLADRQEPADAAEPSAAQSGPVHLAQGIFCAPWALALPYGWARSVVDEFNLVAIPRSPQWMAGMTNVEGVVLPVIDLGLYFSPDHPASPIGHQHRLLVGSDRAGDSEDAFAILFSRLPVQVRYRREAVENTSALPERLRAVCTGQARDAGGQIFLEVDGKNLIRELLSAM